MNYIFKYSLLYYQIFHCIFKSCFYNDLGRKSRVEGKKGHLS